MAASPPNCSRAGAISSPGFDDNLLSDLRLRVSPRVAERAISRHQRRGPSINRRSHKATLEINILTAGP